MAYISNLTYVNSGSSVDLQGVRACVAPADLGRLQDLTIAIYGSRGGLQDAVRLLDLTGRSDPSTKGLTFDHVLPDMADDCRVAVAFIDAKSDPRVKSFVSLDRVVHAIDGPAVGRTSSTVPAADRQTLNFDARGRRVADAGPGQVAGAAICKGAMIDTPDGPRAIQDLSVGDLVVTRDGAPKPIRLINARTITGQDLQDRALWPVCIQAGALGFGLPTRPLWVSQQNRMLYQSIRVSLLFGEDAVLVRSRSLAANFEDVYVDCTAESVTYFQLVFDRHEVIFANGAATETFQPGADYVGDLSPAAQQDLFRMFPGLQGGRAEDDLGFQTLRSWELLACTG